MFSRLIYFSHADISREELSRVLEVSRTNNLRAGLSGVLFYKRPYVLQVLEGPRAIVSQCFLRIAADPRHRDVTLMDARAIGQPMFPGWAMTDLSVIILTPEAWRRIGRTEFEPAGMTVEAALAFLAALAAELAAQDRAAVA
jgi:hypothetical protein